MDIHGEFVPAMGIPPTKITSMILGKTHIHIIHILYLLQLGVIWFDIWSFSADCREEFCWMNEWIEQKIPRVPAIPCLEVCQVWMVGKGNMQTYTQAVKVSATYHTDIYWQHLTAEICWNETICSRFWRSPCLGSQFWCKKKTYIKNYPWTHEPIILYHFMG